MTTIKHLGPYDISTVDNGILAMVHNKGIPVIIKQEVGDKTMQDKDLRIACTGCFARDMKITDSTRCKKCASFVKHWDFKDGLCRLTCTGDVECLVDCDEVGLEIEPEPKEGDLKSVSDDDLIKEVKVRELEACIAEGLDDNGLVRITQARGIWPVFEARPTRLIHELRRQARNVDIGTYYHKEKGHGPHCSDKVGADIVEGTKGTGKTRQAKKQKVSTIHFKPKSISDYTT